MKKSFILYNDQRNVFEALSEKECKELILAIFDYAEGIEKPLTPLANIAFLSIKNQLKRDFEKWEHNSKIRQEYGRRGGVAKASKSYLKPILLSKPAVNVNVNVNNKEKKNSSKSLTAKEKSQAEFLPGERQKVWEAVNSWSAEKLAQQRGQK